jgi:hypothetical protein
MKRIVLIVSAGLLLVVIGCVLYASRMIHRGFSTHTEPMQMEKALATAIRGRAIPSRYKTVKNPVATTPEVIRALGRPLYRLPCQQWQR